MKLGGGGGGGGGLSEKILRARKENYGVNEPRGGKMTRRNDSRAEGVKKENRWREAGRHALICGDFNCLDPQ